MYARSSFCKRRSKSSSGCTTRAIRPEILGAQRWRQRRRPTPAGRSDCSRAMTGGTVMAERRMIHRRTAVDARLIDLRASHGGDAEAFALRLTPFLDRWGCVPDDARELHLAVCPGRDGIGPAEVRAWLDAMLQLGLLERVTSRDGTPGVRVPTFLEDQRGDRPERQAPSPFEPAEVTERWRRPARREPGRMQGGPGPHPDRTGTGPTERKGREGTSLPSPTPSLRPVESAAAPPEPEPGAQAPPPSRVVTGLDALSPTIAREVRNRRAARQAAGNGGGR